MSHDRRYFVPGATYFFTVVTGRCARVFADEALSRTECVTYLASCQSQLRELYRVLRTEGIPLDKVHIEQKKVSKKGVRNLFRSTEKGS
jgi:REP element-mobilizing transposase RayT